MAHVHPNGQLSATHAAPNGQVVWIQAPSPVGATEAGGPTAVTFVPATGIIQQPFVQQPQAVGKYGASFSRVNAIWLGAMLILGGATSYAGAAFSFVYYAQFFESGIGIWAGSMYISAGSVSIAAGKHKTDNLIKAATGTVAAALACALAQIILCGIGFAEDLNCYYIYCNGPEIRAANSLMIAAASIVIVFGIALLAFCGKAMCSKPKYASPVQTGMPVQYVTPNGIPVQFMNPVQNSTPLQVPTAQVHYTTSAPETVQINGQTSNQHTTTTTHAVATHAQNHYEQLTHDGVTSGHDHATVAGVGGIGYVNAGIDEHPEKF